MAVVQGVKEKVHLPIYDSVTVKPEEQLRDSEPSSTLKFFINVQGKTKLETNLQAAGLLPHYNTFEARAMRVVLSDLPPEFPDGPTGKVEDLTVSMEDAQGNEVDLKVDPATGKPSTAATAVDATATLELDLNTIMEKLQEARESADKSVEYFPTDEEVELEAEGLASGVEVDAQAAEDGGFSISVTISDLEDMLDDLDKSNKGKKPPKVQIRPNNGAGSLVGQFIYNTVTTFFVGEKEMIKMPTWFFPAGAGPYSEQGRFATHGEPNPTATFRFAEPIYIDKQQNFRVEIEVPDSDTLKELQRIYGPFSVWVVLDGYMTRDVQ